MLSPSDSTYARPLAWLVLGLAIVLYFSGLGLSPIYILDEAKNAQCAREMMERGDWIVPTFNGELRTDKPPLHYYFMRLGYTLFGVNEWGARFFSAFFGVGTVMLLFFFTRRHLGQVVAFFSSLVFLASINLSLEFHFAVPDPYLIFWISAALFCMFHFLQSDRRLFLYLSYAAVGLAVLTKGPVAVALPGLILLLYLLLTRQINWKRIGSLQPIWGLLIVLAISLPWYLAVHQRTEGAWTNGFFLDHNLNRFTRIKEGHGGFFLMTLAFVILGLLPFSTFGFQAMIRSWKRWMHEPLMAFAWITGMVFLIFFTFSRTKLPNYTMPSYPFFCIVIGYFLTRSIRENHRIFRVALWCLFVLLALLPFGLWFAIRQEPLIRDLSAWAWLFLLLPLSAGMALHHLYRDRPMEMVTSLAVGFMVTTLFFFGFVYPEVYRRNPVMQTVDRLSPKAEVIAYRDYNPAYNFYRQGVIPVMKTVEQVDSCLRLHPDLVVLTRIHESERAVLDSLGLNRVYEGKDIFELSVSAVYQTPVKN